MTTSISNPAAAPEGTPELPATPRAADGTELSGEPPGPSSGGRDGQIERLARSGILNLAGMIAGGLGSLVLVLVTTNGFRQEIAGMLFASTSLFLIVTALSELGTDAGLAHAIQRELVAGRPHRARAILAVALAPVLALAIVLGTVGWFAAPWLTGFVAGDTDPAGTATMLRILAVLLPVATAYDVVLAATRAYGTMRANVLVEKLGRIPAQILAVGAVAVTGAGPVWLAAAWAAPYLPGLIAVGHWYLRLVRTEAAHTRGDGTEARPRRAVDRELIRAFWAFTAPRALGRICQVALQRADIVLVAAMLGPTAAAIYTAATKSLAAGQLGTQALTQVLQPQLSRLFAAGDLAGARAVFRTATAWLMALSWPIYLVMAVGAPLVLEVFGSGYPAARGSLVVLALTMLVATACGPVDTALLMAGRSRQSLGNSIAALVVDLVLIAALVPVLGVLGAAVAWAGALLVRNLLPVWQVWRGFGLFAFGRAAAWVGGCALVCFGLVPLVGVTVAGPTLPVFAACLPVGCLVYAGLLWKERQLLELGAFKSVLTRRVRRLPGILRTRARRLLRGLVRLLVRTAGRLPLPYGVRVALSRLFLRRLRPVEVPLERLLLGAQDGIPVTRYANAFDDLLWASTPVTEGPHLALLRSAAEAGPDGLDDAAILASRYGEHARRCLLLTGRYFWATDDAGIVEVARAFLDRARGVDVPTRSGQSTAHDPILVAPIRDSDCFSVLDGHHRLAIAAHRGDRTATVTVKRFAVSTPLQDVLDRMSWIGGKKELYQPIDAPELHRSWTTVRRCTDRLEKMDLFLTARGTARTEYRAPTYLDVASCYGWFVAQMGARGFAAEGLERDPLGRQVGAGVYGLEPEQIHVGEAVDFL
ncbi:MAG TPA: polysaccharide biosynthesis C-terminal domain-containing protein, partial [Actinopolymorphaceae bacterium]